MPYTNAQKKQHIRELQTYLNAISFLNGHISSSRAVFDRHLCHHKICIVIIL